MRTINYSKDAEKLKAGKDVLAPVPASTRSPNLIFKKRITSIDYAVVSLAIFVFAWQIRRALLEMVWKLLAFVVSIIWGISAAPSGFPSSGNGLWYLQPAVIWSRDYLPIGNGYLAAMTPGGTTQESLQLNIESLWSGGPFADPSYNGGNMLPSQATAMAQDMQVIRQTIFSSPSGTIDNVEELCTDAGAYGSYSGAGYLISNLIGTTNSTATNYGRYLDLDSGIARTTWTQDGATFVRESFCSNPAQACVQSTTTTSKSGLTQSYVFGTLSGLPTPNITCLDNSTLQLTGLVADPGMSYEILASVRSTGGSVSCTFVLGSSSPNASLIVSGASTAWVTWVGGTNYDMDAGDIAHNFSFEGADPHAALTSLLSATNEQSYDSLLSAHQTDYQATLGKFSLDIGQTADLNTPTDVLVSQYQTDIGNPYLEWVVFNYGRYLLASSARGTLPANLQGKWASDSSSAWGADYHSNINIQMNYWSAEITNLDVAESLFDYIQKTWAPRGTETAQILYNISEGWVTHDEMNIFGHTGMKLSGNSAQWADYPESNAWMMIHAWDHFDFTNDISWWRSQGYPLLKSVAQFHLQKLIPDQRFNDGTLVVAPCNSPEQTPITLACAHAQQLIWQMFNAIEKGFAASGDNDQAFLTEVQTKRSQMDKGIHIGSWGQLQEWKVDMDSPSDTHRHLSHLIGLYPGYAIINYDASLQGEPTINGTSQNYTTAQVLQAAEISLIHRGNGTGPDADSGWEKAWRAACWAQLQNATEFYHELTYTIERNFGANLFSLYDPFDADPIFQIDANLGYPGALMNALVQVPDVASTSISLIITLLPALPSAWSSGSVKGARLRGAMTLDMSWKNGRPTLVTITVDKGATPRPILIKFNNDTNASFTTSSGLVKTISF